MAIRLNNNLPTSYQEFIHLSRYSRWLEDKGRRETWTETIDVGWNTLVGLNIPKINKKDSKSCFYSF